MIGQTISSWAGVESKGDHTIHLPGQNALGYLSVPPLVYSLFFLSGYHLEYSWIFFLSVEIS